jgi:hypothetical protein
MVVTSSKEPAWAYPGPSRGRRLHNKRVHPRLQFLVGSSGQPLLPSAIPSTLSTTSHQQNSHQPPAISHRPLAIPILELCFIWEPLPSSSSSYRAWSSPILNHKWRVPMMPLAECLVSAVWCQQFVQAAWSQQSGVSGLVSAVWCQQSGISGLVSAVWCQQSGVNSLTSAVWCQRSGVSGLVSAAWCQRSGANSLVSAICCYFRHRNSCAIFTVAGYVELNLLPNTCSTTPTT